jgi:hypothetical protein
MLLKYTVKCYTQESLRSIKKELLNYYKAGIAEARVQYPTPMSKWHVGNLCAGTIYKMAYFYVGSHLNHLGIKGNHEQKQP